DGQLTTATAELFDPDTLSFAPTGPMLTPRAGHTATLLADGRVLIAGRGMDPDPTAEIYDPAAGAFTAAPPIRSDVVFHTATPLADGTVLIAGGTSDPDTLTASASAEIYDPATDSFAPTGSMTVGSYQASATRLRDGTVLVAGGGYAEIYH